MSLGPLSGMVTHAVQNGIDIPFNEYNTNLAYSASHKYWQQQVDYLNQYNTPLNQLGRLRSAGLNPALAYGGIQNASTASAGITASPMPTKTPPNLMGALEYQQLRTNREQEKGQKLQNELLEEKVAQEQIATDEARQKHIGNVYSFQNAFRQAVAQGGLFYNPNLADLWQDRSGVYNFRPNSTSSEDSYDGHGFGWFGSTPIQYDSALLGSYMLGKMYHDNFMKEYNTHEKDEARINTENERDRQNAQLDYENVEDNYKLLKSLYKLHSQQDYDYAKSTFDDMTNAAISGFKEAIAKNNLLTLMHAGGYLGNESPLLRFFGKKIGHEGWDSLYSPGNYFKIKGDALWNAISQMGVDVLGAYLSRGAHRPFDPQKPFSVKRSRRNHKYGYDEITEYGNFGTVEY